MSNDKTLVLFDAVGTIIRPVSRVSVAYHEAGLRHGSELTIKQVKEEFAEARSKFFHRSTDLSSSDMIERSLWRKVVGYIFSDIAQVAPLFDELWEYFSQPQSWQKFDDVDACFAKLSRSGAKIAVGSNFDSRLLGICHGLFAVGTLERVFCSSMLGCRKPCPDFYRQIAGQFPGYRIVMVGDEIDNDVTAPKQFGWEAFLINRNVTNVLQDDRAAIIQSLVNFHELL